MDEAANTERNTLALSQAEGRKEYEPRNKAEFRNLLWFIIIWGVRVFSVLFFCALLVRWSRHLTNPDAVINLGLIGLALWAGNLLVLIGAFSVFKNFPLNFFCPWCGMKVMELMEWKCEYCGKNTGANRPVHPVGNTFLGRCRKCKTPPISVLCPHCTKKILLREPLPGEIDHPARYLPEVEKEKAREESAALAEEEQDARKAAEHRRKAEVERAKDEREKSRAQRFMSKAERIAAEKKAREAEQPPAPKKSAEHEIESAWRKEIEEGHGYSAVRVREEMRLKRLHPNDPKAVEDGLLRYDNWRLRRETGGR